MTRSGTVEIAAIILAAGKGTRMKSNKPKVLHEVLGRPMVERIMQTISDVKIKKFCLVLGESPELFEGVLKTFPQSTCVIQPNRLGTGDAVAATASAFRHAPAPSFAKGHIAKGHPIDASHVLICAGDTPALEAKVLQEFIDDCLARKCRLSLIGIRHPEPTGYGRLLCNTDGLLDGIVEEKDATEIERQLNLVNSGVIFAETKFLFELLDKIDCENAQGEYYLTDCFAAAAREGEPAYVYHSDAYEVFSGVNSRAQLVAIESWILQRHIETLIASGVTIHMPETCYIEDRVQIEADTEIGAQCSILGLSKIRRGTKIGCHSVIEHADIGEDTLVPPGSRIVGFGA